MKSVLLKSDDSHIFIDIINKEFRISKKNKLHLQTQRRIPFQIIKKITIDLYHKEQELSFTFSLKKYDPYTITLSINNINNNDFTVFLILLRNSHLLIEDKDNIIDTLLRNDISLQNL